MLASGISKNIHRDQRPKFACYRWYDPESREWFAAKFVRVAEFAQQEAGMLELASKSEVPRVVKLKEHLVGNSDGDIVLLE